MSDLKGLLFERKFRSYLPGDDPVTGFTAFASDHMRIKHPARGMIPFDLRPQQGEIARAYAEWDRTLVLKARQIGWTTTTILWALYNALFHDGYDTIALSRREEDAKAMLAMASLAYNSFSPEVKARLPKRIDNNLSKMTFDNGSTIECHPSANNPARGRTARLMVLDEWAFMPNPDEAWASVEPATDIGGQIIALSTANGWGNMFHEFWVGAEAGDNDFKSMFYPWWVVPERDQAWYDAKKRNMPEWQLHQEYPSSPEEAFIKSGNPVFPVDIISKIEPVAPRKIRLKYGVNIEQWRGCEAVVDYNGPLSVYEDPVAYKSYVIGADVAEGKDGRADYSSAHVIRMDTGMIVAHWHGHIDTDLWGYELCRLGAMYQLALLGVEVNSIGLATAKAIQRVKYPRIYFRRRYGSRQEKATEELGWYTSKATKPLAIEELVAELREGTIGLFDKPTITELMAYQRLENGQTEGKPFDDRVMSLAIANQMRKHAFSAGSQPKDDPFSFTFHEALREIDEMDRQERQVKPIGVHNARKRGGSVSSESWII